MKINTLSYIVLQAVLCTSILLSSCDSKTSIILSDDKTTMTVNGTPYPVTEYKTCASADYALCDNGKIYRCTKSDVREVYTPTPYSTAAALYTVGDDLYFSAIDTLDTRAMRLYAYDTTSDTTDYVMMCDAIAADDGLLCAIQSRAGNMYVMNNVYYVTEETTDFTPISIDGTNYGYVVGGLSIDDDGQIHFFAIPEMMGTSEVTLSEYLTMDAVEYIFDPTAEK